MINREERHQREREKEWGMDHMKRRRHEEGEGIQREIKREGRKWNRKKENDQEIVKKKKKRKEKAKEGDGEQRKKRRRRKLEQEERKKRNREMENKEKKQIERERQNTNKEKKGEGEKWTTKKEKGEGGREGWNGEREKGDSKKAQTLTCTNFSKVRCYAFWASWAPATDSQQTDTHSLQTDRYLKRAMYDTKYPCHLQKE